jgi:hypothetical protein
MIRNVAVDDCARALSCSTAEERPHLSFERGLAGLAHAAQVVGTRFGARGLVEHAYELLQRRRDHTTLEESFAPQTGIPHFEDVRPHFMRSVFYGPSGYWFVLAELSANLGETSAASTAIEHFLDDATRPYAFAEFFFGSAGALWACVRLLETCLDEREHARITSCASSLFHDTWTQYNAGDKVRSLFGMGELGFAHGKAGILYVLLRAARTLAAPTEGLRSEIERLACLGTVTARGISWPICVPELAPAAPSVLESWCNGASGFVPLWVAAYETFGTELFRHLALKAACYVATCPANNKRSLCCGLAGHMVAFTYADAIDTGGSWRRFSEELHSTHRTACIDGMDGTLSLMKGDLGVLMAGTPWL